MIIRKAKKNKPMVVIFGRTNVGKSTLFNCLLGKKQALTFNAPGATRDANIGEAVWQDRKFTLIDTGGIINPADFCQTGSGKTADEKSGDINEQVQAQALKYLKQADLLLFTVDVRAGLLPPDRQMALAAKKLSAAFKKGRAILVANKADNPAWRRETAEFNKLGLGEPFPVSAVTGSGAGDLLEEISKRLDAKPERDKAAPSKKPSAKDRGSGSADFIRVCVVGRPNAGKSSLINKLIGEERIIVSPVPHTTREPQDTEIEKNGARFLFVDTAGLSRRGQKAVKHEKFRQTLERQSIAMSLFALRRSDIALLVLDSFAGVDRLEKKITEEIIEKKVSLIFIANKWDLAKDKDAKKYADYVYGRLPFAAWAPIHFCSAATGEKVGKIYDTIMKVSAGRSVFVSQNALGHFLNKIVKKHRPPLGKSAKRPRVRNLKQIQANPPVFSLGIGPNDYLETSYLKYVENRLREKFKFFGTPITIWVEKGKSGNM